MVVLYYLYILINFLNLYHNLFHSSKVMASSAPSAPINSSLPPVRLRLPSACAPFRRGYDRRPDLLFHSVRAGSSPRRRPRLSPPPHFCSHYTTRGKVIRRRKNYPAAAEKLSRGGVKIIRQRNNYPGRARVDQNSKKKISNCPKLSHSAENTLFHIFIHCAELYPIFIH